MNFELFAVEAVYSFLLVFCRVGTALMFMTGFGEVNMNGRARILFALALAVIIAPIVTLPPVPSTVIGLATLVGMEIFIGIFFGLISRMIQASLHVGGMIFAFQSGLASAVMFDPSQGVQGSVIGNFLTLVGVTLFFTADLDHLMIYGLHQSYTTIEVGEALPLMDSAQMAAKTVGNMFKVGLAIASPMVLVGLIIYLGAGIISRLMPNMQVFFVLIPIQIFIGFAILALTLSASMMWYIRFFEDTMGFLFKF